MKCRIRVCLRVINLNYLKYIHQIDHKVVKKKFKLSSLLHKVKKRDKNNTHATMTITTEMKTATVSVSTSVIEKSTDIIYETSTVPLSSTSILSSSTEPTIDLAPQYLVPFEFNFNRVNKTNDMARPIIQSEPIPDDDEIVFPKQNLSVLQSLNFKDKLLQNLKILKILKSSANKTKSENSGKNIFSFFTTPPSLPSNSLSMNTSGCFYNETRLLVSYSNTDIILCRNESFSNRMNCIDKKLKKKIQDKFRGLYKIQIVSNYFMASAMNCSSLLENIKRKNITLTENSTLINTNYTVCSFLNATKEDRIKILWKIYYFSDECYLADNASVPFRDISMRIQIVDVAGNVSN